MEQRLKASITADTAGFVSAINAATKSVGNATDNWATRIAAAQNSFTTASVAAAELKNRIDEAAKAGQINPSESGQLANQMNQAAQAAQQAISQMSDAINEIANGASELGTTVEQFQELQIAANDAGVTMDDVSSAFDAMDNVMREASNASSTASNTLNALGVSLQSLQSLSPADKMLALQSALNRETNAVNRSIYANTLFGNSFQKIATLAQTYGKSLQDAHSRGAIATRKQIDELRNLQRQAQTSFQAISQASAQAAQAGKSNWQQFKDTIMGGNITIMEAVKKAWGMISKVVDAYFDSLFEKQRQEIELGKKNLESLTETNKTRKEAADKAESMAANLMSLAANTDNANESYARQVEILLKLSRGYGDLVGNIDMFNASMADIAKLNIEILQRNHEQRLRSVSAELNTVNAEYERMVDLAGGPSWLASSGGYLAEFFGFKSVKQNQNQIARDASMRASELSIRSSQLKQEQYELENENPGAAARKMQKARELDIKMELEKKSRRQRLKNESPDASKYKLMRMDVDDEARRYKKKPGYVPRVLTEYVSARMAEIDALEKADKERIEQPRLQASAELDTILHQSTLDKYAKMREDAERKVAEMAKRMGVAEDDDRIQQYRSILEQEISAQEQAEQEKADAAKKAEQEKADAAKKAEQEKLEAARRAEQEKAAAARRAEIDRKLSRFDFSEETADPCGTLPPAAW